jgi:hypothetical protein
MVGLADVHEPVAHAALGVVGLLALLPSRVCSAAVA